MADPIDISTLNHISHDGLYNGKMSKIGEFVKSWKVRHFSLTWKYLSYFDPVSFEIIDSIPLSHGTEVKLDNPANLKPPFVFKLTPPNSLRTYLFQVDDMKQRATWIKHLTTLIRLQDPTVRNYSSFQELTHVVVILLNIKKMLLTVCQTHSETRQCLDDATREVLNLLHAFSWSLSSVRSEQLIISAKALRAAIVRLKQAIPFTIRYTLEGFDISYEQRRVDRLLDTLCLSPVEQSIGRDFTDDLKPFLVSLVQSCHFVAPERQHDAEEREETGSS